MAFVVELQYVELVTFIILLFAYIPLVISYGKNGGNWLFAGYTAVFLGSLLFVIDGMMQNMALIYAEHTLRIFASGAFFVTSAYLSHHHIQKLNEEDQIEEEVSL